MRTIQSWLDEYGESHRNPVNKKIHWVCVPLIMLSVLGMLWFTPRPGFFTALSPYLNWATLLILASLVYYALLSPRLAAGMLIVSALMCLVLEGLTRLPWPLLWTSVAIFAGAWVGQFIGHKIEGRKPSFFKDLQFLLIGPVWLLADAYKRLGFAY
ncbi:MAG TPA: Mpo1-like protein [Gammaproteobacteria bacterium]|nr:Mpo1-like protein [Gammaproteobacteria bacterium]